jgi:hypothetical protein
MTTTRYLISDRDEFARIYKNVSHVFDLTKRFPDAVCLLRDAKVFLFEYDLVAGADFWPSLCAMARLHSDNEVDAMVVDPDPVKYFNSEFGLYSAFRLNVDRDASDYWDALTEGPPGWEADALRYRADVWAAAGPSRSWGLWNDRPSGISSLYSKDIDGLDRWASETSVPILAPDGAELLIAQEYGATGLPGDVATLFRRNFANAQGSAKGRPAP